MHSHAELERHSAEFEPGVIEVTEGVHVAIGYALANSILIEGDDGVVIVDTLESAEAAEVVKAEFDKITTAPVKAIIYTHNHVDHCFGARVFAGDDGPDVYSHATTLDYLDRVVNVIRPIIYKRSMRQFGTLLPPGGLTNAGIGPRLVADAETTPALIRPNRTFSGERYTFSVAGIDIELVHAPGETPDQIFVWLPDKKVLLPGDNFYKSFPNLYAIRGTPYRDVTDWVESLDKMRAKRPEFLIPSHTRPIVGADEIHATLTDYRDAIQYVHDQTVRAINRGMTPDEIVGQVRLPEHLASRPYLKEYYGTVEWSVRSIFAGYLGWFGGNATDLSPSDPQTRAARVAELAGGRASLLEAAQQALDDASAQWALELADAVLALEPDNDGAKRVRAGALRALASEQISANGRNYYLTQAMEAEGSLVLEAPDTSTVPVEMLRSFPVERFMRALPVYLDGDKSRDTEVTVGFHFTDTDEHFTVRVRKGVAEVDDAAPAEADIGVTTQSMTWKEILSRRRNVAWAVASGDLEIDGSAIELAKFLLLFR